MHRFITAIILGVLVTGVFDLSVVSKVVAYRSSAPVPIDSSENDLAEGSMQGFQDSLSQNFSGKLTPNSQAMIIAGTR